MDTFDQLNSMIKMDYFLQSLIGSGSDTGSQSMKKHLTAIDQEIDRVEALIQSSINSNWSEFQRQWSTGSSLYRQSQHLESELIQSEKRLNDPQVGLIPNLLSALKEHRTISADHTKLSGNLSTVESLLAAYQAISSLSQMLTSENLVAGVNILPEAKIAINFLDKYRSTSSLAKRAIQRLQELEEDLKQRLIDDVRAGFFFRSASDEIECATLEFNVAVNTRSPNKTDSLMTWGATVEALENLSGEDCTAAQLKRIANVLIEKVTDPLIESFSRESRRLLITQSQSSSESCGVLSLKQGTDRSKFDLYDSLRLLLSTLHEKLLITKPLQDRFSPHLLPSLELKLLTDALDSALPSSSRDTARLTLLSDLLSETRRFGEWLQDHGWLSICVKNGLIEWCDQVQNRFLQKVAKQILDLARSEMIATQWESINVPWEVNYQVEPSHPSRQPKRNSGPDPSFSPAIPRGPFRTSMPTSTQHSPRFSEAVSPPKQAAGLKSLFSLISSNSHPGHPSVSVSSNQPPEQLKSPQSQESGFRSLFNFGAEREVVPNPGASNRHSSSTIEGNTFLPEIIDHLSDLSLSQSAPKKPSSPKIPSTANVLIEGDHKPEEDVDWDMDAGLSVGLDSSPNSGRPNNPLDDSKDYVDGEIEDDAWGLDEPVTDTQSPETTAISSESTHPEVSGRKPLSANSNQENAECEEEPDPDAWGFEPEEEPVDDSSVMRLRGGVPSPASSEIDDEGWGWNEDISSETPAHQNISLKEKPAGQENNELTLVNEPVNPAARVEQLTISKLAQKVLGIVVQVVEDAIETEKPDFPCPFLSASGPSLVKLGIDVLDLFRIVMAVHHSNLLDSVPSLGVQFANDCVWLSKQILSIPRLGEQKETESLSKRLKELGAMIREKQLTNQRAALMECLNEAEGFVETSREDRFSACQRACRQVDHTLERLAHVWKPVMLRVDYLESVGHLVEDVLSRILNEIEEQVDIEENDSKRLNLICKSLHSLIRLFELQPEFDPADIYRYVPSWFKFCFLSELLEASMADIMWMYREGHLSEFSRREIVGLIKALFADSEMRAKNIDFILR